MMWLVFREERVVVHVAKSVRMLARGLQPHQVYDVNDADLEVGKVLGRMETAARTSRVGVSPQQAITTSGSDPLSLLAHCHMPMPPCNG